MLDRAYRADVVVVGAGIAGLAAAAHLTRAGVTTVVLEAAPCVGGRMATEKVDGFRLDRIGRPLSTAYPELHRTPGLEQLVLRPFAPGVLVHSGGHRHRAGEPARPRSARGALTAVRALTSAPRNPRGGPPDRTRRVPALARLTGTPVRRLPARPELSTAEDLAARGLPPRTVDGFLRPLLAALLCDPELITAGRGADRALHAFVSGRLCLPEGGADTMPELLANALPPGTVHTGVRATAISTTSVRTEAHGTFHCRAVILATGARAAAELLPGLRVPTFHQVTVVHHTADEPPLTDPSLLLDADRVGPVAHTAVTSQIDPTRAPAGRALISSTVLGPPPPHLDETVRRHLSRLYGTSTSHWELLTAHHDPEAVPTMPPPYDPHRPVRLLSGLYVCGDHRDTNSVQGALHSARRAARAALADIGGQAPTTEEPVQAAA
ncbi:NAD(P)/FAD-dependent oxidoreductase [Streptomyces cavernae]|uniref:NAD(P)/FAD-dependent oxidoreductase n=1 Tax=Streptomyces cavernae TaxID=2259034 RepID=UPI000FEBF864|nr:NAD(P)/FAD-dependent oxidoreductase [Streptomyces cavernae]